MPEMERTVATRDDVCAAYALKPRDQSYSPMIVSVTVLEEDLPSPDCA